MLHGKKYSIARTATVNSSKGICKDIKLKTKLRNQVFLFEISAVAIQGSGTIGSL